MRRRAQAAFAVGTCKSNDIKENTRCATIPRGKRIKVFQLVFLSAKKTERVPRGRLSVKSPILRNDRNNLNYFFQDDTHVYLYLFIFFLFRKLQEDVDGRSS